MNASFLTMEYLPQVLHADREEVASSSYLWANRNRVPAGGIVIQRTIRGAAFLREAGTARLVGPGQAMIFAYGEETQYGTGEAGKLPYLHEYASMRASGGVGDLARQIRKDFGSVVAMSDGGEAARLLHETVLQFRRGQSIDQLEMAERAYRLLLATYREQVAGTLGSDPVSYLRLSLQTQFRSPKNLKEWMAGMRVSREHLTRLFTERYGEGPATYLRRLRLGHARLLARTSGLPDEAIAAACGFSNVQTFRRAFRREFGTTAGGVRNENG